jgi:hypothetical protein
MPTESRAPLVGVALSCCREIKVDRMYPNFGFIGQISTMDRGKAKNGKLVGLPNIRYSDIRVCADGYSASKEDE